MTKIRTILIGLGDIGYSRDLNENNKIQTHYKALSKNNKIELIGVVDKKKIRIKNKDIIFYNKLNEITSLDFELAVVAVPTKYHFRIIKFLIKLKKLKAIICEKPFTNDIKKAVKLISDIKKKKKKIYFNYFRRSIPSFIKLKKLLNREKNCEMKIYYSKSLLRNGCHFIDLAQFFFGKVYFNNYNKNNKVLKLKSKKCSIIIKKLNHKSNKNYFEICNNQKNFIVDENSKIFKKQSLQKNNKIIQILKNSRNEMNKFQKLSLDTILNNYLTNISNPSICSSKDLLNTLRIIDKTN